MGVRQLLDRVRARQAEGIVAVPVASEDPVGDAPAFVPGEVYLEVRLRQMWLTNERELWREYQPFGAVVTEFIRDGRTVSVPSILGANELSRRLQVTAADDAIEIGNIRVAGPVPYEGDDVSVLLALFRTSTTDWVARSLKVVEDVASAIGFGGLTASAKLADALVRGIDSLLDVNDVELRVGAYCAWSSPTGPDGAAASATELRPTHYAIMRRPRVGTAASDLEALRVKDGRLHRVENDVLVPYSEHDFMLISVEARKQREDVRRLPWYELWTQTLRTLYDGDLTGARQRWLQTAGAIFTDDLTRPHRERLYQECELEFATQLQRFTAAGMTFRGTAAAEDSVRAGADDVVRRVFG